MVLAGTHHRLMLFAYITLSWCVFSRDYCISGQLKSNISLGITKTVTCGSQTNRRPILMSIKKQEFCFWNSVS